MNKAYLVRMRCSPKSAFCFPAGNYLSGANVDGSLEQLLSTSDQYYL
jgi:hypothetical protein